MMEDIYSQSAFREAHCATFLNKGEITSNTDSFFETGELSTLDLLLP